MPFESLAPVTGEGVRQSMSARIRYTDEPLGRLKVVGDFLPRPEDLVFRDEGIKVTIALSKRSVEFFKTEARKHNTQYQRMIRRLLDAYTEHHLRSPRRSEEHTSELQSRLHLVCRLLLEKKKKNNIESYIYTKPRRTYISSTRVRER